MKRYMLTVLTALCVSCTDFVDYVPEKIITDETFFKTDDDMKASVDAIYYSLLTGDDHLFGRALFWEICAGSDDMIYGRTRGDDFNGMVNFKMTGRETAITRNNQRITQVIAEANWLIKNMLEIGENSLSATGKRILGEAYFIRGFAHFLYAYRMGRSDNGVPFDRYEDREGDKYGIPQQRASVTDNYALIIEDLVKAADRLPFFESYGEEDYGRAHKAACWAVMVKTYAYWAAHDQSKWSLIPSLVDKIETEGKRALLPNFHDVFTVEKGNWSAEEIWSINNGSKTGPLNYFVCVPLENQGWGRVNGWGYFKPTLGLYNEFADGDKRRAVTMLEYNQEFQFFGETRRFYSTSDLESGFMLAKYLDPYRYGEVNVEGKGISPYVSTILDGRTDLNIPLFRFAESLLFKAEALVELGKGGEAAQVLNRLTRRAGLGDVYATATISDLIHERRCELAGEFADRYGDLRRWSIKHADLALPLLKASKTGRRHADRSNPESPWTTIDITEGDKTRNFNPSIHIVFPYNPDDVVKAGGKLKQNKGYD